jgi:hypothetical protein
VQSRPSQGSAPVYAEGLAVHDHLDASSLNYEEGRRRKGKQDATAEHRKLHATPSWPQAAKASRSWQRCSDAVYDATALQTGRRAGTRAY